MFQDMLGKVVRAIVTLPAEWLGALGDLLEKMCSSEGQMWFSALKRFLRKENPWELKLIREMTLQIGGVTKDELVRRLTDGGNYVSNWARDLAGRITTLLKPRKIKLGWITVRDLGFTEMPTTPELLARIKEVGDLCPAEVGPHLRLADADQPRGTWYWVAMEPITDSGGYPGVFFVERNVVGERWLFADCAKPDGRWDLGNVVVFLLRK